MDTYVYGVLRASAGMRAPGEGVDEQAVEVVEHDGLAALVSDAPAVPVKANRRNLMAHSNILQEVVRERCVLPMQFGVVMPGREAVAGDLLGSRAAELRAQLDAFEPYVELGVRALCPEEALLRTVVAERPEITRARDALAGRPEETTYYERIHLGELVAQAAAERKDAVARQIAAALEPLAAATELGERVHEEVLANMAFLVERGALPKFDAAVEKLGEELAPLEVRLRYLGPLPPHHFVDLGAEAGAWA